MSKEVTREEFDQLCESVKGLAKQVRDVAMWLLFVNVDRKKEISKQLQRDLLKHSKGHITYNLYKEKFKNVG